MCRVKRFKRHDLLGVIYYGREVCWSCWSRHCDSPFLKSEFNIQDDPVRVQPNKKVVEDDGSWKKILKMESFIKTKIN